MPTPKAVHKDYNELMLKMYMDAIQQWKETCDKGPSHDHKDHNKTGFYTQPYIKPLAFLPSRQNPALHFFRRMVENQVASGRFFENRLLSYRSLPDAVFRCTSPLDLISMQATFAKQAIDDYAKESARMLQWFMPWVQQAA